MNLIIGYVVAGLVGGGLAAVAAVGGVAAVQGGNPPAPTQAELTSYSSS